ncbi:Rha family transcriptional regulator [Serratia sp. IR-2025]
MNNETDLKVINGVPMMGSRAIANTTNKEHKNVVRDIKVMLEQLGLYVGYDKVENAMVERFGHGSNLNNYDFKGFFINHKEYNGRTVIDEIWLNEDLSMTLITGYDPKRRLDLIEQWQRMKVELTQPRIAAPAPAQQAISTSDHILSVARVVAEATASATMKAVMDVIGQQVIHAPVLPTPEAALITEPEIHHQESEFVPVIDLVWKFGLSDAACRRLASYSNLPTKLTNGERGYLLVHNVAFSEAFSCLIEESTPPTGKLKRWQHPDFGGFALKITEANKAAVEAKR